MEEIYQEQKVYQMKYYKKQVKSGVSKINVDTDLRLAMTAGIRKVFVEEPKCI